MDRSPFDEALAALAAGDRSAFDTVYAQAWPRVRALCLRLEPNDGEDIAQTALLKVFERAGEYDPARPGLPWVLGVAHWEVRTWRKKRLRRRTEAMSSEPSCAEDPEMMLAQRELEAAVAEVLGTLRPQDQQTLLAAAGLIERPVQGATFRKRVQRAVERLRVAWRSQHG